MAVDPFVRLSFDDPADIPAWMGRPMTREDALRSPRIETVWAILDALSVSVDPIAEQVTGGLLRRDRVRWGGKQR